MTSVALLSFWHVHAGDYAGEVIAHPEVELAAVWDEHPERGRPEAAARGVPFVADLDAVLSDPAVDGVIVTSATAAHGDLVRRAAASGKHIFIEKVLAPTLAEALRLVEVAERAGVTLGVALSRAEHPAIRVMRAANAAGEIGVPVGARVRIAHDGVVATPDRPGGWLPPRFLHPDESGGGAMIDLGAHPLYLTRLLLGMPDRISAAFGSVTGALADDNAVAVLAYESGALGVAETSFVNGGAGFTIEVSGTAASMSWSAGQKHVVISRRGAPDRRVPLPPEAPTPFARWIEAIRAGTNMEDNLSLALELSALADACGRSAQLGRTVALSELKGWDELVHRHEGVKT